MQRVLCDQLVKCMEVHNKNIFAKRVDPHNEITMRACVELLLKHGRVPVITAQNIGTMQQHQHNIEKSKMLTDDLADVLYTQLSFVKKGSVAIEEYAMISVPTYKVCNCAC